MEKTINDLEYQARRALVIGTSGTGKTTLAERLIYTHPASLVLIYDWQGAEFAHRLGASPARNRRELAAAIERNDRIVSYSAEDGETDVAGAGFDWFCEMAFELGGVTGGRKLFVVDEVQGLIDPYNIPEPLEKILTRGRRRLIDTCLVGSAANAIHTVGRDQVNELYVFRCVDDNSLKYPSSLGLDAEEVRGLPDTHYIFRDGRTGEAKKARLWDGKE